MLKSRVSLFALAGFLALVASPIHAQNSIDDGRDASFLPRPAEAITTKEPSALPPATVVAPSATAPAISQAPPPAPITKPAVSEIVGKPVESGMLGDIDPESIGLYGNNEGGLGASLWKGTSREVVTRLLPHLNLPTSSPALNNLARRFLLTTAGVPVGVVGTAQHLTAMRVEKLVMLGDAVSAWKLVQLAKPEHIDEITLRRAAEAALTSSESDNVCAKLPDIIKDHTSAEWQKLLLICQLKAKDTKAAQLTIDLLRAQGVKDEAYFSLVEKTLLTGTKQLPRRLTPLNALILALLQQADLPVPAEIYARPEASLIPPLLRLKAKDDNRRLELAEKAASGGLITAAELEAVYASISFTPEILANAASSSETGGRLHALLYQAALSETVEAKKIDLALKFMRSTPPSGLNGTQGQVLVDMLGTLPPNATHNTSSASLGLLYMVAGKPEAALEWLKLARQASAGMPALAVELERFWPLTVLVGLESDSAYNQNLTKWLDEAVKIADAKSDDRAQRERAGNILLLLDAAGFVVQDSEWAKVMEVAAAEKRMAPPALLVERLRAASAAGRRGETVLFGLLVAENMTDKPFTAVLAVIRGLRAAGLTADAASLAREMATALLLSAPKP
ncbi:MAG: hypothetical protein SFW62_10210 [Alphaproteobacteria bacterium]|nr:hypothetical protein [Alphaproteobacteria bacterium]